MALSRQEQERQRQREEARRRAALERRQDEDRQRAREEARRAEARQERLAFEAELESARSRREAVISRLREERRGERAAAERAAERRSGILDRTREEQQERRRGAEAAAERRERMRQATAEARRLEDRTASSQTRAASERDAARRSERRAAVQTARDEDRSARAGPVADEHARSTAADRARADRRDRARRDAEAADRAAAARATRLADARSARLEEVRALRQARDREATSKAQAVAGAAADRRAAGSRDRRRAELAERARAGAAADRRDERRGNDRLARASAEQAAGRRERDRAARLSAERTVAERARSRQERVASRPTAPTAPAREPLDDPIPSGILSGSLPWLRVEGTRLVTARGDPVTLRGANVLGLGPPGQAQDLAAAGLDEASIETLLGLGVGAVRVPIDRGALDALADLDRIVEQVAANGAYTILNLPVPQPGDDSFGLWRAVGERYGDEPAVLFDLFAAPDVPLPDDPPGLDADWDRWSLWVRLTVAELRRAHPRAVCIVAGLDWGTDLTGFPIVGTAGEPIPNLVYATTLSPDRPQPPLAVLARRLPILVTELDVTASAVAARTATLAALGVGWIVAARSDRPLIAPSRGGRLEPTVLGTSIQRVLTAIPGRPLIEPPSRPPSSLALTV